MGTAVVVMFIGLLVFLAHLFVALFERTRIPDVLYLILIGVIIGPVLNIVTPEDFGKVGSVFTLVALVVILFEGSLELTIDHLRSSWRSTIIITLTSYVLSWAVMTVAVYYLVDLTIPMSLFVGAVLAGPAPAVVIPLVRQLKISKSTRATMTLETPLGEALCIIVALSILDSLTLESVQVGEVIGRLLSSFLVALFIGGIGGFAWSILLERGFLLPILQPLFPGHPPGPETDEEKSEKG